MSLFDYGYEGRCRMRSPVDCGPLHSGCGVPRRVETLMCLVLMSVRGSSDARLTHAGNDAKRGSPISC